MSTSNVMKKENRPMAEARPDRDFISPQVDIRETKDGYLLEAEMPGVNKSGLEVLLEGNELTLVGRREVDETTAQRLYRESSPRDFRRVFVLDPAIDAGKIEARIENGILRVTLPKAERVKPRKITVS